MNYLAHLYLADYSDDALLGALLGDFVGSRDLGAWAPAVALEIRVHRRVDSYTDAHPLTTGLRALFPQGRRRYAGIALDMYFDHLLARDWGRHHALPLREFSRRTYDVLLRRLPTLPPRLAAIAPLMAAGDWLGSYARRDSVNLAVSRIARRLSRRGEALVECLPILRRHEAQAEAAFAGFFPQLVAEVPRIREALVAQVAQPCP